MRSERERAVSDLVPQLRETVEKLIYAWVVTPLRFIEVHCRDEHPWVQTSRLLKDIHSIREANRKDLFRFVVEGHEDLYFWSGSKAVYDKFLRFVQQGMEKQKRQFLANTFDLPKSPEERLRTLIQLHKDGLIDDSEFEQKRKEILGQL